MNFLRDEDARSLYAAGDAAHDFDHVLRVTRLEAKIGAAEGAEATVVRLAALLHDLPAAPAAGSAARLHHHHTAATAAAALLRQRGAGNELVEQVVHCIRTHRFRDQSELPQTLEARVLYDADKLDAMGAIGVARAFAFAGSHDNRLWSAPWDVIAPEGAKPAGHEYTPVHEYVFKLRRLQATLYTATGRAMGQTRHRVMVDFFARLDAEMAESAAEPAP